MSQVPRRTQEQAVFSAESSDPDQVSVFTAVVIDPREDLARQEFAADTDVETVLRRHGGAALTPAQPLGGYGVEVDYDLDLSAALAMVADARAAYSAAPADLRRRFPTFGAFVQAVQAGRVAVREVEEAPTPPQRVVVVPDANQPPA